MSAIRDMIRKGQVIMTGPADLPDETEVEIVPVGLTGSTDEEGAMSPDEIARNLAAMDEIEPFEMTHEERETIEAGRQAHKQWEEARFNEHADRLRRMWDREDSSEGGTS